MRVVLVTHLFPPDGIAGVERYTQRLAAQLAHEGDTVAIVTKRDVPSAPAVRTVRERLPDGTVVHRLTGGQRHLDRFLVGHERLEELFNAVLVEAAPDVVHFNHLLGLSPRFIEIAHRHRAAVVFTLHDYYFACPLVHLVKPEGEFCKGPDGGRECARTCFAHDGEDALWRWGLRTAYFRRLLFMVDHLISPSQYLASFFKRFGVPPDRLDVIRNGIPADFVENARPRADGRKSNRLQLAFFGTVVPHKGVHVILEALQTAGLDSVDLMVFGNVPEAHNDYGNRLRAQAETIPGLRFRMYGQYQYAELRHLLRDVDCAIVPSQLPENFPLVTQEALIQGIPILASRLGGIPEIVVDEQNGLTFDHRRPEELAGLLRRLDKEPGLLERLREGARKSPVLSMPQYTETVRRVYRQAIEKARQSPPSWQKEEVAFLHGALLRLGLGE
jgi:glycosyltransferase involved in cell wall biosynthesis